MPANYIHMSWPYCCFTHPNVTFYLLRLTPAAPPPPTPPPTAMGNAGHDANMELARIVPGVDVVVAAPTLVVGAEFPQMVSDH